MVVTRWFGGIKLGAGGLVRAWGGTAAECLRLAPVVEVRRLARPALVVGLADVGAVHGLLARAGALRLGEAYGLDVVRLRVELPETDLDALRQALADATRGRGRIED